MREALRGLVEGATVVDLSHALTPEFPLFPVYDPVQLAQRFSVEEDGFFVQKWTFDEHCGTHVDAPAHFGGAQTVDQLDARDLLLHVAVVDIRERVAADDDATVVPDDVLAWESRHGPLPARAALFALTGWGERAGDAQAYLNADDGDTLHFPGFAGELADFLKEERPGVRALGIDVASLDIGASSDYPVHVSWLPSGRYGIENVARLESVPPRGAITVVGVPPYGGGSGGPARILAILP